MTKKLSALLVSVLSMTMSASGAAAIGLSQADVLDVDSVRIVRLDAPRAELPIPTPRPGPGLPGGINPDIIVNIGKIIMGIIEANRPVVDVKQSYAVAVPSGIKHWTELAGWSAPQATSFLFTANSGKGAKAIDVRYQVLRTAGGNYQGKGKYLTGVTVEPVSISVSSGFKFSLEVSIPPESVANVGTSDEPVAGMVAMLRWKIEAAGKETRGTRIYYLQGDGAFQEIGGNSQAIQAPAREAVSSLENPIRW